MPNDTVLGVRVWQEDIVIPTYLPEMPDKNPMFLEKRVYQGSSGCVYPLPFTDRIAESKTDHTWKAVWIENPYVRVMLLPEIGGRIHAIEDKSNGYDLIYRQNVIKPALVGLSGPWASGGIEFNWPQHHRPSTFMPVDVEIENHPDGSATVWMSEHDPMARMKGMHGVCLYPDRAYLELKVRCYNRTPFVQTFLWWANAATRVHESYQSFFPPDVYYVADHAKRAMSLYPLCEGHYYGVDYGARGRDGVSVDERPADFVPPHCQEGQPSPYPPNDLSWYANIPVPTSYMCMGSQQDFVGGYDHARQAGLVHVADHHIAPGKKQWTWGNHEFGYAWDRNLTDTDGPYIEIMAGVYTDNQPDFSFLQPGETKTWSQYWYPIEKIGPPQHANRNAAVSLSLQERAARLGVAVSVVFAEAKVSLSRGPRVLWTTTCDLAPGAPLIEEIKLPLRTLLTDLTVRVIDALGQEIIAYQPEPRRQGEVPTAATEPPLPEDVASTDELFVIGMHLDQYRHATRCPTLYWREALRRDPLDWRSNNRMGLWHLRRGEFEQAEAHFRKAIERLTERNANPYDGEPLYNLGLCLRYRLDEFAGISKAQAASLHRDAYAAFYKATWNQAWAGSGYHALAEMDCRKADWARALEHIDRAIRLDADNLRARDLKVVVLRKLNRLPEAANLLAETRALDPLDWWARQLSGDQIACDVQTRLDLAHDYAKAGLYAEAIALLQEARVDRVDGSTLPTQDWGASPLIYYTLGWLYEHSGSIPSARRCYKQAAECSPDYCFPARLEDLAVLRSAIAAGTNDARTPYYLGNLLYDRRRYDEAIAQWERSAKLDPSYSVVWRNLGIAYCNVRRQPSKARTAYERACDREPTNARLFFERDQLWKRLNDSPSTRLREMESHLDLVGKRDDLTVELCTLYNQTGQYAKALELISSRHFQPWEGGEGQALGQYVRSRLAAGRQAMERGAPSLACKHFQAAIDIPRNLGEAKHLLANQSDIHYELGCALAALGETQKAVEHWTIAANSRGDFQEMSVRTFSEMTYYSAKAWQRLGNNTKARKLLGELLDYAERLERAEAKIDYFATSLPTLLLFDDDIQFRQETTALFLQAQARLGLGDEDKALALLETVLQRDPNHALAADLAGLDGLAACSAATLASDA